MSQLGHSAGWLSPTRAWRLIECPASVRPAATAVSVEGSQAEVSTGTLAHRALERWVRAEGYREENPKAALAEAADACADELPAQPPSNWRVARARLVARSSTLMELIGERARHQVQSEIGREDAELRLRGQLDLLLLGDEIVVVDLKTQTLTDGKLPARLEFQLMAYAHLVRVTHGRLPARAEVFSLNRGRIDVPITSERLESALEALALARAADPDLANPDPETCFFCDRRTVCEPHWDVAQGWPATDAVEGELVRVETASSGVSAVLVATSSGEAWVSGIPTGLVASAGQRARFVRLNQRAPGADGPLEWRWTRSSALAIF